MADGGSTMVETIMAVTVSGVAGLAVIGALHTLAVTSSASAQRTAAAAQLASAQATLGHPCLPHTVASSQITVLDPCPGSGPLRVRLDAGSGRSHRHLTVIVDGGP